MNQIDLIDIYRTFHPKPADYTFFSTAHRTFSRMETHQEKEGEDSNQ